MSEYMFGTHTGHLTARADKIAARHGASHINYTELGSGRRCGWFVCSNRGAPFDQACAQMVWGDIELAGGLDALRHKRDREEMSS